ncbi:hypothetical protein ACFTAO_17120 [Paenibacillus rhizoplanae]
MRELRYSRLAVVSVAFIWNPSHPSNIAQITNRLVGHKALQPEADSFLSREYRPPFRPPVHSRL